MEACIQFRRCFQEAVYSPGDLIIRKGAIGEEMFFIVKGTVEVLPWLCWLLNRVLSWKVREIQSFESTNRNISSSSSRYTILLRIFSMI